MIFFPAARGGWYANLRELGELQGFFSFNYLIGKLLHSASPFYYQDFAPRCAGRGCGGTREAKRIAIKKEIGRSTECGMQVRNDATSQG
jgi:hypothetical protein